MPRNRATSEMPYMPRNSGTVVISVVMACPPSQTMLYSPRPGVLQKLLALASEPFAQEYVIACATGWGALRNSTLRARLTQAERFHLT